MAKDREKTVFLCGECGYESPRWMGRCPACGSWNTLVEEKAVPVRDAGAPGAVCSPAMLEKAMAFSK